MLSYVVAGKIMCKACLFQTLWNVVEDVAYWQNIFYQSWHISWDALPSMVPNMY